MEFAMRTVEADAQRHEEEGTVHGDVHEFDSVETFQTFLSNYREATEDMSGQSKSAVHKSVLDDNGVLGTSKQFAFSLGQRNAQDSILAGFAHTVVDYFSEGVFTLVVTSLLKYIMVAIIHVLFYEFVPDLGMFVSSIDWDTAFLLLNFVVGFIIQGEIRSSVSRFSQHPRAAFGFYRYLIHTSHDLCEIHKNYRAYGRNDDDDDDESKKLNHLFAQAQLDLVSMAKMVVGFFQEMETRGSRTIQDEFELRITKFFGVLSALRLKNVISTNLEIHYRDGLRGDMEPVMAQTGFGKRFIPNKLVQNHLDLVILIYLWIFVPIQLYASTGFMVVFIYPMMMLIFDMVQVLDRLQGQPFSYQSGQHHPNDYRTWEKDALRSIYDSCLLANVDYHVTIETPHDMYAENRYMG